MLPRDIIQYIVRNLDWDSVRNWSLVCKGYRKYLKPIIKEYGNKIKAILNQPCESGYELACQKDNWLRAQRDNFTFKELPYWVKLLRRLYLQYPSSRIVLVKQSEIQHGYRSTGWLPIAWIKQDLSAGRANLRQAYMTDHSLLVYRKNKYYVFSMDMNDIIKRYPRYCNIFYHRNFWDGTEPICLESYFLGKLSHDLTIKMSDLFQLHPELCIPCDNLLQGLQQLVIKRTKPRNEDFIPWFGWGTLPGDNLKISL